MTPTSGADARPVTVRKRIVRAARVRLFIHGHGRLTMNKLSAKLGMSKKTLDRYFSSKEDTARQLSSDLGREGRSHAAEILANKRLRFAPEIYELTLPLRRCIILDCFERLLAEGLRWGLVRRYLAPGFAAVFLLLARHGLRLPVDQVLLRIGPQAGFEIL